MCCGAIDGKHVVMQCPPRAGSSFFNSKGTKNSVVMIYMYILDCKFAAYMWERSVYFHISNNMFVMKVLVTQLQFEVPLRNKLREMCTYLFTGGDAFPLKTWMMKPYPGKFLDERHKIFNYHLSRAR